MSIEHFKAAFKCRKFSGNARLLLLALADHASNGTGKEKYGWCFAGTARLMMDTGIKSRETITDNLKVLLGEKVIRRQHRMGTSSRTFVDIERLNELAYTEEDKQEFERRAQSNGTKKSSSRDTEHEEDFLPSNAGTLPASEAGNIPATVAGKVSASTAGTFPAHNPQSNPQIDAKDEASESESEPDSDSDVNRTSWDDDCEDSLEQKSEPCFYHEPCLEDVGDYYPVCNKSKRVSLQREPEPSSRHTAISPVPVQNEPEPDPQEYAEVVHLCSLWWSTHEVPEELDHAPAPEPAPHPWGHPRTWTPQQRREAFLKAMGERPDSWEQPRWWEPETAPEQTPDARPKEDPLLKDEEHMLALYLEHGRDELERVLRWLPKSDRWHRGERRLTSLAQLRLKRVWEYVSGDCEKYYATALGNGSEADCEKFVEQFFLDSGGDLAGDLCYYRLNPIDIDPEDAAEEEAMDAIDDEYGNHPCLYPETFAMFPSGMSVAVKNGKAFLVSAGEKPQVIRELDEQEHADIIQHYPRADWPETEAEESEHRL